MTIPNITETLSDELTQSLQLRYGVMLGSKDLWHVLGFPSANAFRQAISRGTLQIPLFEVKNRRGRFALTKDVAEWIASQRFNN
ncbi:pyocin activator PrtN family protein [Pseudomonas putida]|uniref:pyocin activator PrtN family protein n=1 Tax=Pseudomonas putida TaxID=303 RepID=UPI00215DF58F|nr:pyocin activator PrtN family protein [Pseudomonas putida]UVL81133.1 pyocin activator PrtN family protein [Pseudomonas putida]